MKLRNKMMMREKNNRRSKGNLQNKFIIILQPDILLIPYILHILQNLPLLIPQNYQTPLPKNQKTLQKPQKNLYLKLNKLFNLSEQPCWI